METNEYISIQQFCTHYNIPVSFISSLHDIELIKITTIQRTKCIDKSQIIDIEKMMRLHFELDINIEGIDAIHNLLKQVETLNKEINELNNKLNFYESK